MTTLDDLKTPKTCTWCPSCGNFGIWAAFKQAAVLEGWDNTNTAMVAGIGCHGHMLNFVKLSSFEGLHGRPIPVASGIKTANNRLNVFVFTGDGDCLGEGGNHFIHTARRNEDLTVILHDNAIYGLTTGQTSPRSPCGYKSKSTPGGNPDDPINPLAVAISAGATFVARAYTGDLPRLTDLLIKANRHKGFSVLQILQPCVTFNKEYSHNFYQENIYHLDKDYNATDKLAAFAKSLEWGTKQIPTGILYQTDEPSCEGGSPQIKNESLVDMHVEKRNVDELLLNYK